MSKVANPALGVLPQLIEFNITIPVADQLWTKYGLLVKVGAIRHGLLLLPVIGGSFFALGKLYQKLSDLTFVELKRLEDNSKIHHQVPAEANYSDMMNMVSTLMCVFIVNVIPILLDVVGDIMETYVGILLPATRSLALTVVRKYFLLVGIFCQCMLYSWVAYNFHWITTGVSPGRRFEVVERRWEYFMGFGLPVTLAMRMVGYFPLSYGLYLAFQPFMITASNTIDYHSSYKYLASVAEFVTGPKFDPAKLSSLGEKVLAIFLHKKESSHKKEVTSTDMYSSGRVTSTTFHLGRLYFRPRVFHWPNVVSVFLLKLLRLSGADLGGRLSSSGSSSSTRDSSSSSSSQRDRLSFASATSSFSSSHGGGGGSIGNGGGGMRQRKTSGKGSSK
jgi:uncharacterized membrane protein YgcG